MIYRAAITLHDRRSAVDQVGHDLAEPLRTHRRRDLHRMHHVSEQHRRLLVLGMGVGLGDGCTTAVAESRALW